MVPRNEMDGVAYTIWEYNNVLIALVFTDPV